MVDISVYTDPGVYQSEVINPTSLALSSLTSLLTVVGTAPRVKQSTNEAIRRGQVIGETVSLSGTAPHRYTLASHANRRKQDTQFLIGTDLLPDMAYSYVAATVTGPALGAGIVVIAGTFLTLQLDHLGWVTIPITAGAARTATHLSIDINTALVADPRYGTAYATAATVSTDMVVLTSPLATSLSDIRFLATSTYTPTYAADALGPVFGVVAPYIAPSIIELVADYYSGTATYEISYVAVDTNTDPLSNAGALVVTRVGLFANVTSFVAPVDYSLAGDTLDWSPNTQAVQTAVAGPYATTGANILYLSVNGIAALAVTLTAGAAITAAAVATSINQALIASASYGPLYGTVATVAGGTTLVLTAPAQFRDEPASRGSASTIEFYDTPANAVTMLFGISSASLPYQATGASGQPAVGAVYFASYQYTRPTADYNNASVVDHLFTTAQAALEYTTSLNAINLSINQLGMAASIAFENDAPRMLLIQVDDRITPGMPTINEVKKAIDAAKDNDGVTDIVVMDTRLAVQTYLIDHVTTQSSLLEKSYRTGWYGMTRNTAVGDRDTADSFVYRAQVTLQVPPDSPGRGRMILTAPANVAKTFTMGDATERTASLNSCYLAVACAARQASFLSVATSLLRKTVVGFDLDTFQVYTKADRRMLASNGVNVVTLTGGRLVLTDPVSTEQGAGGIVSFVEPSATKQKDRVMRVVDSVIDQNLVGIVPTDIADFVNDVKGFVSLALRSLIESGDIARYKNSDGTSRDIDLTKDMQVYQSPTDPRTFRFRYFFNLRYPAKRFFGELSVDNPLYTA